MAQTPLEQANAKIQILLDEKLADPETSLEDTRLGSTPAFSQLESLSATHWSVLADSISQISGSDAGARLLFLAFESLPAADYIATLEKFAAQYKSNQISATLLKAAFSPSRRMRAFLADNYQKVQVQNLLNGLSPYLSNNQEMVDNFSAILGGTAKQELDSFREAYQGTADGDIPVVPLP